MNQHLRRLGKLGGRSALSAADAALKDALMKVVFPPSLQTLRSPLSERSKGENRL